MVEPDARTQLEDRFIECWGDIATLWGVPRSTGRVHALLYLAADPLSGAAITERLQMSHGNCSTSLRDLLAWGVIRRGHPAGERKAHYESERDPWTWFHTCIQERRRREVKPVQENVHAVVELANQLIPDAPQDERPGLEEARERIERFSEFMDEFLDLIDLFLAMGSGPMGKALRAMAKLR